MTVASVRREGDVLAFAGTLVREAVPGLWAEATRALDGASRFDLSAVERVDSAGLALLAGLAQRAGAGIVVAGEPQGLPELRRAYRLSPSLSFASA